MKKSWISFLIKLAVSAALITFLVVNFDLGAAAERLKTINLAWVLGALALFLVLLSNNALRWMLVCRAIDAPIGYWPAFRLFYIGIFFNQTLPSSVGGDAVRMFIARREGMTLQGAVNGVMLDRAANVLGLIILVLATQPFLLEKIGDNPVKYVFPVFAVVAVIGILFLMTLDRLPERLRRWSVVRGLGNLAGDTRKLFLSPAPAIATITLGVISVSIIGVATWLLALSIDIRLGLIDYMVLMPPVILITTIPISVAGWGVREGAMVAAFGFVGLPEGDAFVLSILLGLGGILISLPGGLVWLSSGYKRADIQEAPDQ